nr:unnamed protein product [Callosobruchus analis]
MAFDVVSTVPSKWREPRYQRSERNERERAKVSEGLTLMTDFIEVVEVIRQTLNSHAEIGPVIIGSNSSTASDDLIPEPSSGGTDVKNDVLKLLNHTAKENPAETKMTFLKREFGCKVSDHIPKEKSLKWDEKRIEGTFLGHGEDVKRYRVYFSRRGKVQVVRDMIFLPKVQNTKTQTEEMYVAKNDTGLERMPEITEEPVPQESIEPEDSAIDRSDNNTLDKLKCKRNGRQKNIKIAY